VEPQRWVPPSEPRAASVEINEVYETEMGPDWRYTTPPPPPPPSSPPLPPLPPPPWEAWCSDRALKETEDLIYY